MVLTVAWEDEVEVWKSVPPPGSTNPFEWPRGRWNEIHLGLEKSSE